MTQPLHRQGKWVLLPMTHYVPGSWKSWIVHKCGHAPHYRKKTFLMVDIKTGTCPTCKTPVPDEIFGVWRLHNFDMMGYL